MNNTIILDPRLITELEKWSKVLHLNVPDTIDFMCRFGKYTFKTVNKQHEYTIPKINIADSINLGRDSYMYLPNSYHFTQEQITERMSHIELCGNRLPVFENKLVYKSVRIPVRFKDTFDGLMNTLQVKKSKVFRYVDLLTQLGYYCENETVDVLDAYVNHEAKSTSNHCQANNLQKSLHSIDYEAIKLLDVLYVEPPKTIKLDKTSSQQLWNLACMLSVQVNEVPQILNNLEYATQSIGTDNEEDAMSKVDMLSSDGEVTDWNGTLYKVKTFDKEKLVDQIEYWSLNLRIAL